MDQENRNTRINIIRLPSIDQINNTNSATISSAIFWPKTQKATRTVRDFWDIYSAGDLEDIQNIFLAPTVITTTKMIQGFTQTKPTTILTR